jgi:UDP-3-O-[3-hydroxymyristoyl] N-acetylglucosamine deacetylase
VEITLRPAQPDTGIVFRRVDLPEPVDIPVSATAVTDTRLASTIVVWRCQGQPVEHLMSACAGLGVDNLYVDITAEEIPILDGSAASFVFSAAKCRHRATKRSQALYAPVQPVEVREGQGPPKWARLEPYHGYKLSFEIDFRTPRSRFHRPACGVRHEHDSYSRDIARARTFGFTKDVEMMRMPTAWHWVVGWTMPSSWTTTRCSMPMVCGMTTSSSNTSCSMPWATCIVVGKPLLASYSAFRSGHALNCWQQVVLRELARAGRVNQPLVGKLVGVLSLLRRRKTGPQTA